MSWRERSPPSLPRAISRCDSRWTPRFRRPVLRESEPNYNVNRAPWNGEMHESGCADILEFGQREMTLEPARRGLQQRTTSI